MLFWPEILGIRSCGARRSERQRESILLRRRRAHRRTDRHDGPSGVYEAVSSQPVWQFVFSIPSLICTTSSSIEAGNATVATTTTYLRFRETAWRYIAQRRCLATTSRAPSPYEGEGGDGVNPSLSSRRLLHASAILSNTSSIWVWIWEFVNRSTRHPRDSIYVCLISSHASASSEECESASASTTNRPWGQ